MNSDPIADFLTRIRNAAKARHKRVDAPLSKEKLAIANILKDQGFIADYTTTPDSKQGVLTVTLRYHEGSPAFTEIKRISRPGIRQYSGAEGLPRVKNGLGIAIISTSQGIMTDKKARSMNVGGEIICTIW